MKLEGARAQAVWESLALDQQKHGISDDDVFLPMLAGRVVGRYYLAWREGHAYHAVTDPVAEDVEQAVERMQAAVGPLIVQYVCEEMMDIRTEDGS